MDKNIKYAKFIYNKFAKEYFESMQNKRFANHYIEIPAIKKLIKDVKGKKVLDCGCSTGTHSKILLEKGAIVTGLDISNEMIKLAKTKVPKVNFIIGDMQKLPFKKNSFDLVFYGLCIHYAKDIKKVLKEANRVLKTNGKIIISTNNPISKGSKKIIFNNKKIRVYDNYFSNELENWEMLPGMKIKTYTNTISDLFNKIINSGFKITKIIEPKPIKSGQKFDKKGYEKTMKLPYFIIIEAVKE